jgi:hypothetical protein
LPCIMGQKIGEQKYNWKNLLCKKLIKVNYRTELTEDEEKVLKSEKFWEIYKEDMSKQSEEGFEIHTPSGLPVVRFMDGIKYTKPMVYNFSIKLTNPNISKRPFSYRGEIIQMFEPMLYGRSSMKNGKGVPCFGKGLLNGEMHVFYKKGVKGKLSHVKLEDSINKIVNVTSNDKSICFYLNKEDWSPLEYNYKMHVPGIEGSETCLLNYAGFLRSNNNTGFNILRKIFEENGGFMPAFVEQYMPNYPRFNDKAIEVSSSRLILFGDSYISHIKNLSKGPKLYYNIVNEPKEASGDRFIE